MRIPYILFFCLLVFRLGAQINPVKNHLSLNTYRSLQSLSSTDELPVLIKGDVHQIESFIRQSGENIQYAAGDIISAALTKEVILQLNAEQYVEFIECPRGKLTTLNDVMVKNNNVDSAFYGYAPLTQSYDGTGVVIGIIDAPFDINHGDFTDAEGNTRIKSIWDQNVLGGPHPDGFGYGKECDSAKLADGTCTFTDNNYNNYSHGTGVAGVAASSGNAANAYRGVAPNADIVLVSLDFQHDFLSRTADAIQYIFEQADAMGKPCVINTSFGTYAGSHDGNDLTAQIIDNMISEHSGRSLVAACGNAGAIPFHLGYDISATEKFTWFNKLSYADEVYFQLYADTADLNNAFFSIAADNPAGFINIGSTADLNIKTDFTLTDGDIDSVEFDIPGAGTGKILAQLHDGTYFLEFEAFPTDVSYLWRFTTSGEGRFDIWSGESTTGYSNFVTTALPDAGTMPEIVNYMLPNTAKTTVSSWQCSDKVITVGSYVNRDTMTNYYGDNPPLVDTVGALYISSSHGPTRDGRIKPDICASGARILSSEAQVLTDFLISEGAADYMTPDGMHYLYNGTSFASPIVTGIAALYFEEYPFADHADVKDAILSTATKDTFTGDLLPDNLWGYGKANAFRALIVPLAAIIGSAENNIFIYPNPAAGSFYIDGFAEGASLEIYAMNGQRLRKEIIRNAHASIDISMLENGIYELLVNNNGTLYSGRLTVIR